MGTQNPLDDSDLYEGLTLHTARQRAERATILGALERNWFNVTKAAEELEMSRPGLSRAIRRLGIARPKGDE